jgi:SAM-dependent methyltransferase
MTSIPFDRAAGYYDATRGYGEGAAERIRDAIVRYTGATASTRFLELGVGTGRIALPFIRAGYDYTGVDISQPMMDQLAAKLAGDPGAAGYRYELRRASVTALPFADDSFDVAIAVHVLHLVEDWQAAVREARRVLRRGSWLLVGYDEGPEDGQGSAPLSGSARVRAKWYEIRDELGIKGPRGRSNLWGSDERLVTYLRSLGARTEIVRLAEVERPPIAPRQMAERLKARMYSSDWDTPDELHAEASRRLDEWLAREVAAPDQPVATAGRFKAIAATWPTAE